MNVMQAIADNLGDLFGTSKLAQLNSTVFRPITGMSITREEYNMCDGQNIFDVPDKYEISRIKSLKGNSIAREREAKSILNDMVDNGTVFSDSRIIQMNIALQTRRGEEVLPYKVKQQLSNPGRQCLKEVLHKQVFSTTRFMLPR